MSSIKSVLTWKEEFALASKPWILLGKGPSFDKVREIDTTPFFTCSLNHVVRELPVTLAHFIDIEAVLDCKDVLQAHAQFVVLPFYPHVQCKVTRKTLPEFIDEIPELRALAEQGRVLWYNLDSGRAQSGAPVVKAGHFSAEAALEVLAMCGAKEVRSIGVDGGSRYSEAFSDLNDRTLLANGHADFNRQFLGIADVLRRYDILFAPWGVQAPVRVFVGADSAQMAGVKLLEYSIKKFASISVEVTPIDNSHIKIPQNPANRSKTGFSFGRFDIPRLCGYRGRGIYMDADMQVFGDIRELWTWPMGDVEVAYAEHNAGGARVPQFSVLLLNCEKLSWDVNEIVSGLDEGRYDYKQLMQKFCFVPEDKKKALLPEAWNSLEKYEQGVTRLIHYTDMNTQPWVTKHNKNGALWYRCLAEAVREGFIAPEYLYGEIEAGHISPEVLVWSGLPDPRNYARMKTKFVPPFLRFARHGMVVESLKARLKSSPFFRRVVLQNSIVASVRRSLGL